MTYVIQLFSTHAYRSPWLHWFANDSDQDLQFDEGLEEFDDEHPKPPSRRPLLIILMLLLVAGAGYLSMNPDLLSSVTNMIAAPGAQTAEEHAMNAGPDTQAAPIASDNSPPPPSYHEGAVVLVIATPGDHEPISLTRDAQGSEMGPTVKTGDLLTVVDGAFINNSWVYMVNTKSGATGWINEHHLQSPS